MSPRISFAIASLLLSLPSIVPAQALSARPADACPAWEPETIRRNPTEEELRCRYAAAGPGRFGLLSYVDVPVYQPETPMPGTHVVGIPGHARPYPNESYEAWEWRVLRTDFGPEAQHVFRGLEVLDMQVASRIMRLEARLVQEGISFRRRETWRAPERQAYLFQQGRSRPGPLATATLTSWHSQVNQRGLAAGRAVDYDVPASQMPRFHQIAWRVGLQSFGADSNDPGHVFLPDQEELSRAEVALLRILPRVPEVTLATGLPVDQGLPPGGRSQLRAAAVEFASLPFFPYVAPSMVEIHPVLRVPGVIRSLTRGMQTVASRVSGSAPSQSADGGAPYEPSRSAASEGRKAAQNRDG